MSSSLQTKYCENSLVQKDSIARTIKPSVIKNNDKIQLKLQPNSYFGRK